MKKRLFLLTLGALAATTFVACSSLEQAMAITDDKVIIDPKSNNLNK